MFKYERIIDPGLATLKTPFSRIAGAAGYLASLIIFLILLGRV